MKIYRKTYKTIPDEKVVLIARISKFNNERYGFETSNNRIDFEKNVNMPMFWTEKEAYQWIESKEDWKEIKFIFNTTDTELMKYNGTEVEIIRPLTENECDVADVGNMYKARFFDGYERDVFEDELTI